MNTKINYLYRDASNYKIFQCAVLPGEMTDAQQKTLWDCCATDENYFIPSEVGLHEERFDNWSPDDWEWFEFEGVELTDENADTELLPDELVKRFEHRKAEWASLW